MKKRIFVLAAFGIFTSFVIRPVSVFAQNAGSEVSDFSEDIDFDSIFEDAADVEEPVIDEPAAPSGVVQVVSSAFSSIVHFSGSFSGEVGVAFMHKPENDWTGYLSLKNTLNMSVVPSSIFSIRGSVYTGLDNGFSIALESLYFDYLFLDHLYISAGKKSVSWGYTRLFNDSTYYGCGTHSGALLSTGPLLTNIFSEDGSPICVELRYPWRTGTLSFVTTANVSSNISYKQFNYYGSFEFSVKNTSINIFAKYPNKISASNVNNLVGLELKRTVFGYDVYAQGICRFLDMKKLGSPLGYDYITGTAGFYRLFDSFDPNIGFNIEYQYEYNPDAQNVHNHRVAFEGGLKRLGKNKNMKIGVMSHYNFTEMHGFSGLNFIVSGLFPYADWSNKVAIGYGKKYAAPVYIFATTLSLSLDY